MTHAKNSEPQRTARMCNRKNKYFDMFSNDARRDGARVQSRDLVGPRPSQSHRKARRSQEKGRTRAIARTRPTRRATHEAPEMALKISAALPPWRVHTSCREMRPGSVIDPAYKRYQQRLTGLTRNISLSMRCDKGGYRT